MRRGGRGVSWGAAGGAGRARSGRAGAHQQINARRRSDHLLHRWSVAGVAVGGHDADDLDVERGLQRVRSVDRALARAADGLLAVGDQNDDRLVDAEAIRLLDHPRGDVDAAGNAGHAFVVGAVRDRVDQSVTVGREAAENLHGIVFIVEPVVALADGRPVERDERHAGVASGRQVEEVDQLRHERRHLVVAVSDRVRVVSNDDVVLPGRALLVDMRQRVGTERGCPFGQHPGSTAVAPSAGLRRSEREREREQGPHRSPPRARHKGPT